MRNPANRDLSRRLLRVDATVPPAERRNVEVSPRKSEITEDQRAESLADHEKQILETISTSTSPDGVLTELVELVESQFEELTCSIMLMDGSGTRLRRGAVSSLPDAFVQAIDELGIGPNAGACGTAAFLNQPVIVSDIASSPHCKDICDLASRQGFRACWSSPIRSPVGSVLGTIAVYYKHPRIPDAHEKKIIGRAIHLASIAIERKRSKDAIARGEQKIRRTQQIAHVGSFELAPDASPRYWSDECCRIVGLEPDTAIPSRKQFLDQVVHPDDREVSRRTLKKSLEERRPFSYEYRVRRPDGSIRWVHSRGEPICDDIGQIVSIEGTLLDITERRKAEETARASELRSRSMFEGSPVCIKIIDLDFRLRYMSAAGKKQLKIADVEPLYGNTFTSFYSESWQEPVTEHLERAKAGETCSLECPVLDTNGVELWFDTTFVPDRDEDGRVQQLVVTSVNITERRKAEVAARASERRSRAMLEGSPVCTKIIDLDFRLQYMSAAGQKQLKISDVEPLYGTPFPPDLYPEPWRAPVTEHLERAKAGETCSLECPVLDTEGVEVWIDTTVVPDRDEDGRVQQLVVTSVNITERRKAEERIRQSEEDYRALMENHLVGIAVVTDGRFVFANEQMCNIADCALSEILGRSSADVLVPIDRERNSNEVALLESGAAEIQSEREVIRSDGTSCPVEVASRAIRYRDKPAILSVITDVTERKKVEEETRKHRDDLAHVSRLSTMGEMATGIAHELNQPLSAITLYSSAAKTLVERLNSDARELQETLSKLEGQAIRAGEIVRRLREFVKKSEPLRLRVDLNKIVEDVAKFVDPDIRQAETSLVLKLDDPSPSVVVDEIQIQQVLVNLIRNAIDAMSETPIGQRKVTVSTRVLQNGDTELIVSDAGKGLSDAELEEAFDTFYSTKQEGMGMGLPISRSIVEAHGGKLWSKSNLGAGATFGLTIPPESGHEIDPTPVVFIVDDEPVMRDALGLVVRSMGLAVKCFSSAHDFLDFIGPYEFSAPACLIADVQMPKMNGIEFLEQLNTTGKKLPVILMTGNGALGAREKAANLGAAAFFEKPCDSHELGKCIRRLVKPTEN